MIGLLRAAAPWAAVLVGMLAVEALLELGGDSVARASRRTKTVVQAAWWLFTVAAACGAIAWFLEDPASDVRTKVAILSCVGLPSIGLLLGVMAALSPGPEGRPDPGILPWRRRARAGSGVTRNDRLRRD